tara:strand:+ start:98 stop:355 length:258 start_codon:yes stop_codon:yes gene_type:complete
MAFKMKGPRVNISYAGESPKQENQNLNQDNPIAKHASAMNMSVDQDNELPQEGGTSPVAMIKKVIKPKFKRATELPAPQKDKYKK